MFARQARSPCGSTASRDRHHPAAVLERSGRCQRCGCRPSDRGGRRWGDDPRPLRRDL